MATRTGIVGIFSMVSRCFGAAYFPSFVVVSIAFAFKSHGEKRPCNCHVELVHCVRSRRRAQQKPGSISMFRCAPLRARERAVDERDMSRA